MHIKIDFFQNDFIQAIGAGVYEISIQKDNKSSVLYIGESVFVLVRCASHLYELKKNPEYFGFTHETITDPSITLRFRLLKQLDNKGERKKEELNLIKKIQPLTQRGVNDYQKKIGKKVSALTRFLTYKN